MSLEVRAAVVRATRAVIPLWPLSSFIAVNPLGSREAESFATVAPIRARATFLADHQSGRITDSDLVAAALDGSPELAGCGMVTLGARAFTAAELVAAELVLTGDDWAARTRESPTPDLVDSLVSTWVGADLDPHPLIFLRGERLDERRGQAERDQNLAGGLHRGG